MKRITTRNRANVTMLSPEYEDKYTHSELIDILIERLAAYEETGLSPEDIQEAVDLLTSVSPLRDQDMPKEFKSWVERCAWHVRKCAELSRSLSAYKLLEKEGRLLILPNAWYKTLVDSVLGEGEKMNRPDRKGCPMRHKGNGNCLPFGGFCTAVNDPICEGLHNAYDKGWAAAATRAMRLLNREEKDEKETV